LGQKTQFLRQKQGFPNIPNLRNIRNLFYSKLSKNYKNITLKSNFGNREKLVPTQILTRTFEFKLKMQGLIQVVQVLLLCVGTSKSILSRLVWGQHLIMVVLSSMSAWGQFHKQVSTRLFKKKLDCFIAKEALLVKL